MIKKKVYKHGVVYNCDIMELIEEVIKFLSRFMNNGSILAFFGSEPSYSKWASYIYEFLPFRHEIIWNKGNAFSLNAKLNKIHEKICICGSGEINDYKIDFLEKLEYQEINNELMKRKINMFRECFNRYDGDDIKNYMLKNFNEIKNMRSYTYKNNKDSLIQGITRYDPNLSAMTSMLGMRMVNIDSIIKISQENVKRRRREHIIKHPTVKPTELMTILIQLISKEGEVIFDPFIGSGSTAVACLRNNRRFIVCEIDEEYFNLTCSRIENEYKNNMFLQ